MGIVVDEATGWLAERGFLTNVLSSLTGFFFAVPLAVLVLSEVNAGQEERRAVRALLERAAATTESILSEATRLVQPEPDDLRRRAEATRRKVSALRTVIAPDADDRLSAASEALTGFLHGWTARWPDPSQVAASLLVMERRTEELALISSRLSELTSPLDGLAHPALPLAAEATMWVSVTVDTAPEPGSTLADTVSAVIDPNAPETAKLIIGEVVATAPAAAADVDTRVSVTFDPKASATAPKDLTEAVGELGRTMDTLASALGGCGVTVVGRATAAEIAGMVRTCYDPASRGEVNRLLARPRSEEILGWCDAGPVGATEYPDRYEHDGGISVSWGWHEPPRQNVRSDVLARLVAPGPYPKRVTLQYRALPAAAASRTLQQEVNAAAFRAQFRRRTGRDETARDAYDTARARQAAGEEAMGAGVCLVSMYATVTVTRPDQLAHAVAHTEAAAGTAKIRLRRLWGSQAAGFATTLPCGICPAELSRRLAH